MRRPTFESQTGTIRRVREIVAGAVLGLVLVTGCATATGPGFPVADIRIGGFDLTVWVADDGVERRQGLQGVAELPADIDGMLFTWDDPLSVSFSMRNTVIPLDIWWIDGDGLIIGSARMEPCLDGDCVSYRSPGPVAWVLETPAGSYLFSAGDILSTTEIP